MCINGVLLIGRLTIVHFINIFTRLLRMLEGVYLILIKLEWKLIVAVRRKDDIIFQIKSQ